MEYKLQKSTNKFTIIFTGVETNELVVTYNLTGWGISPLLKDDKVFMKEVNKLVSNALKSGQLSDSANDYKQDPETELFVNIVINAYKTMVDHEATVKVIELVTV
jgi:hypothetical protein